MAEEQANENKSKWLKFFQENWSWVTPLIYIYVSYVGMVVSWYRFERFGINVFEFSEFNDFLLAAFREPKSLPIVLIIIFLSYAFVFMNSLIHLIADKSLRKLVAESYEDESSPAKRVLQAFKILLAANKFYKRKSIPHSFHIFIVVSYALLAPKILTEYFDVSGKESILNDSNRQVNVVFVDKAKDGISPQNYIFLGTTDNYVFFYDKFEEKATVVPFVNIQRIEHNFSTNLNR